MLADEELRRQFEIHLVQEFAVESLRFWEEANNWKSVFDATDPSIRQRRAEAIYRTFLQSASAPLSVNVPDTVSKDVAKAFANNTDVPKNVFDAAIAEVFQMMRSG